MADTTTTTTTPTPAPAAAVRPTRPDEETFKKELDVAQKEHDVVRGQLNDIKAKIDSSKPGARSPREHEIREELSTIKSSVAAKKSASQKTQDQIRALQDSINTRTKELSAKQKAMPYRSIADLEAAVKELDKKVASGMMKIVDEKRALQEISTLNKQKRGFAGLEETQASVDADRVKLKELKERKVDPEQVKLNERFDELNKELNELRAEHDVAQKNINSLRDERSRLQKLQNEKWDAIKTLKDTYHQNRIAYREYSKEARKAKDEKFAKIRADELKAKKLAAAAERMEEASEKAFQAEVQTCEALIGFFDPSSAEATKKAKAVVSPRELAAKAGRTVEDKEIKGRVLVKKEEDFFVGGGGKKKGKKPKEESEKAFKIEPGLLEQLAKVGVETPGSREEIPGVLAKLREKLAWYLENQEKVTNENIAKAKKELEKLEDADKKEEETTTPEVKDTPAPADISTTAAVEEEAATEAATEEATEEAKAE